MYKKEYVAPSILVVVTDLQSVLAGSNGDSSGSGGGSSSLGNEGDKDMGTSEGGSGGGGDDLVESKPHTNAWSVWDD